MELPGKRKRGRPKRRFMDVAKEDMAEVEVTEEDTVDRNNWRRKIRCGNPDGKSRKKKKKLRFLPEKNTIYRKKNSEFKSKSKYGPTRVDSAL